MICTHTSVECLSPYEIIRKYRCVECNEVMMCECDEEFARRYLPHQINSGTDMHSKNTVPVTLGFQPSVCPTCRGLPEQPYPVAEIYGRTSKIERYYWREISFGTIRRFAQWAEQNGHSDWIKASTTHHDVYKALERETIDEIKILHQQTPKYVYLHEESQNDVIVNNKVEVIDLKGSYVKQSHGRVKLLEGNTQRSVEEFAQHYFERLGYQVMFTESIPFHALFGVFMWMVIQDPCDPRNRMVMFGNRQDFEASIPPKEIRTFLPEDFGTRSYYDRRLEAINRHFELISSRRNDLDWLFDYWKSHSEDLRQYLWAHKLEDVTRARAILSILPFDSIMGILRYLVTEYWKRYLGWPDLLVYGPSEYFFVEVKSSSDKLSEAQKDWIRSNHQELHLPFKLVKIHRSSVAHEGAEER